MKVSNKIHRGTAIAAAIALLVLSLGGDIVSFVTLLGNLQNYDQVTMGISVLDFALSAISIILTIVVLLRGKKDTAAGVIFVLILARIVITGVLTGIGNVISFAALNASHFNENQAIMGILVSNLITVGANLVNAGFYLMLAIECFKPGRISSGRSKPFLVILPVAMILLLVFLELVRQFYLMAPFGLAAMIPPMVVSAVIAIVTNVGIVLQGLSFSVATYEQNPYGYTTATQTDYNSLY